MFFAHNVVDYLFCFYNYKRRRSLKMGKDEAAYHLILNIMELSKVTHDTHLIDAFNKLKTINSIIVEAKKYMQKCKNTRAQRLRYIAKAKHKVGKEVYESVKDRKMEYDLVCRFIKNR